MSLPFWQDKCWGRVLHCFSNPQASVSYLEVLEGNRCSRHYHRERANTFIVVSGVVEIEVWDEHSLDSNCQVTYLMSGDSLTVPSGKMHRFKVLESGTMIEVYFPDRTGYEVDINDIVRFDVGGSI